MQHSASLQRVQPQHIIQPNGCFRTTAPVNMAGAGEPVFEQRYHALRDAGFEHETASKYSSLYSSVNEVIDTILSQSLIQQLAIESGNNCFSNKATTVIQPSGQPSSAGVESSQLATNLPAIYAAKLCSSRDGGLLIANDTVECALSERPSDLIVLPRKSPNANSEINHLTRPDTGHLSDTDHFDEADKTRNGANCFSSRFGAPQSNSDAQPGNSNKSCTYLPDWDESRLGDLCSSSLFNGHELNGMKQLKSICDLVDGKADLSPRVEDKANQFNEDYSKVSHYFDEDSLNGAFNNNLLVTVLKDGFFESDEALEDEGVVDQNATSPSVSSSLFSSGASSLLLDSSSSPSSFSSLSSSISTTPPDALNGFESTNIESTLSDARVYAFPYSSQHLDNISLNGAFSAKCAGLKGNSSYGTDLTEELINKHACFDDGTSLPLDSGCEQDVQNKAFLAYNEACFLDGFSPSKSPTRSQGVFPYPGETTYSQFNNSENELFEGNFNNQSANTFIDGFGKLSSQPSDDSSDLLALINNASFRQQSLFEYEKSAHMSESFGLPLDGTGKTNLTGKPAASYDSYGDFAYRPDAFYVSTSPEADTLGGNLPSGYPNSYMNQRTFADIAASNVISNGAKGEHCLGAIGDPCKSPRPNSTSCSNLNMGNLNSNYYNLFANNSGNISGQNVFFCDQASQGIAKKSFYGQANDYRTSLSPISGKMYSNVQMMGDQMNFTQQPPMRPNLQMGAILGSTCEMIHSNGDSLLNKPTNLMAYKGLWVCNISPDVTLAYLKRRFRRFGHFTGIQTFERRATNGSNIVFVHYDNPYSPVEAIACLHNYTGLDLCADQSEPLKLRFAPSMEQSRAGQLPTLEQARKLVERHGECFNYRLSSGCHRGIRCQLKHVPINKEIDSQPWVSASPHVSFY